MTDIQLQHASFQSLALLVCFCFVFSLVPPFPTPALLFPAPPSHQFTCLALLIAEVWIIKLRENRQNWSNHGGFYTTPLAPTKNSVISFSTASILKNLTAAKCCCRRKKTAFMGKVKVAPLFLMCQLV